MPRIGSRQNPANAKPEADDPGAMSPYAPLDGYRRDQAVLTGLQTLDTIQRLATRTRNKDGKLRRARVLASVLAMRMEGFTPKETAEMLGLSHQQVTYALAQVRKDADIDAQVKRLDDLVVPLAIDNVARGVMNGDKEYTLRVLDGRGVFRTHQTVKGDIKATLAVLHVALEMPAHLEGKPLPLPKAGSIVGAPTVTSGLPDSRVLEGVVVGVGKPFDVDEFKRG